MNLNEIKKALSKATPGPWVNGPGCIYVPSEIPSKRKVIGVINKTDNAELVANAPQWLASLVSEVERLKAIEEHAIKRIKAESRANAEYSKQVEEMQKTLEWYAEELPHKGSIATKALMDRGAKARRTLQSLKEDKT